MDMIEPTRFSGTLSGGKDERISVVFNLTIDACGDLNLEFEPLLSRTGARIITRPRPGRSLEYLELKGTSPNGQKICSDNFYLTGHCCPVKPGSPACNDMILNGVLLI